MHDFGQVLCCACGRALQVTRIAAQVRNVLSPAAQSAMAALRHHPLHAAGCQQAQTAATLCDRSSHTRATRAVSGKPCPCQHTPYPKTYSAVGRCPLIDLYRRKTAGGNLDGGTAQCTTPAPASALTDQATNQRHRKHPAETPADVSVPAHNRSTVLTPTCIFPAWPPRGTASPLPPGAPEALAPGASAAVRLPPP